MKYIGKDMEYDPVERQTRKISGIDELYVKTFDLSNREYYNLGLNFRQRIGNFALSLSSDFQVIEWDKVVILIKFKNEKKKLFEAIFEVLFYKSGDIIYSVGNIALQKHTYKPFIN